MKGYLYINYKYPFVRREEYNLITKCNIKRAKQLPAEDPLIFLPSCKDIALSFINTHHLNNIDFLSTSNYKTIHFFEVEKNSNVSLFLDRFITDHRKKKHKGNYLSFDAFNNVTTFNYKWHLPLDIASEYLINLFSLDKKPDLDYLSLLNYDGSTLDWSISYALIKY